ncbi:MAG: sigma-54 dependent transcriptional regulator, partial [Novosphingobium sp.]|nr:sigma-54 dependent transcriptional regulator [Novosphingobium sp.]
VARGLHEAGRRRSRNFVAINCAALPESVFESEMFGVEPGAFTGATRSRAGKIEHADGGTLFLDEIEGMPPGLQAKLLRVLQERVVERLGSNRLTPVDCRIVAATKIDLKGASDAGLFRADLYYRLNVFPLALRALGERPQDVAALAFAMVLRHTPKGQPVPWLGDAALAMLKMHNWPGNIRELENVVRRALLLAQGCDRIEPEHIIFDQAVRVAAATEATGPDGDRGKLSNIVQISEARAIMATLEACGGRRSAAAKELGISERTLRYRLASFRDAGIALAGGR